MATTAANLDDTYRHKAQVMDAACEAIDRDPATMRRSMMIFGLIADDERSSESSAFSPWLHLKCIRH